MKYEHGVMNTASVMVSLTVRAVDTGMPGHLSAIVMNTENTQVLFHILNRHRLWTTVEHMFPKTCFSWTVESTRYSVPQASQTRLVKEGVIEFTKIQSGAIHMDGWSDLLNLEQTSRFYVEGSNLPNNAFLVEYKKITVDVSTLTTFHTSRMHAEISCFETNSETCGGLVYVDSDFDKFGFGTEDAKYTNFHPEPQRFQRS